MQIRKKFGEILVEAGVISKPLLDEALASQKKSGLALGRILEDLGVISDSDIITILANQFKLSVLKDIPCPNARETLFQLVDCDTAIKKTIFPIKVQDGVLELAISNPLDFDTLDKIAFKTGMRIQPVLATPSTIFRAIKSFYLNERESTPSFQEKFLLIAPKGNSSESIRTRLKLAGYQLFSADDITDGIKLAQQHHPHLIFLETKPLHSAVQKDFLALQDNDSTRGKPILALTAGTDPEEEAFLLGIGFFDTLPRPVNFVRLLARTQRAIRFCYYDHPINMDLNRQDQMAFP